MLSSTNTKNPDTHTFTKKVLLIGPMPNFKLGKMGGARISFSYLVDFFQRKEASFYVINTQQNGSGPARLLNPINVFIQFFNHISKVDMVFVNMSMRGTTFIAPLLFLLSRLFGKKFIFRPFGSRMKEVYEKYTTPQKWIFKKTLLQSDIFFLQTLALKNYFKQLGGHIIHLPTSRDTPPAELIKANPNYTKKLVFLGHVKESKGIDRILETVNYLEDDYTIHIYGPIKDEKYQALFTESHPVYKGSLRKEEVLTVLAQYDILLLPTYFEGEGYPGVIIEAYSLGLPVIVSHWKSIPEIVEHQKTGILVTPKSTASLVQAIKSINPNNYPDYSRRARSHFEQHFNADTVLNQLMQELSVL